LKSVEKEKGIIEGGRCIRGKDGKLGFNENARKKIRKEHMEQIINEENE